MLMTCCRVFTAALLNVTLVLGVTMSNENPDAVCMCGGDDVVVSKNVWGSVL